MLVPEIKKIEGSTWLNPSEYIPSDPRHFWFQLSLFIGPRDSIGKENFVVNVCTPSWFAENKLNFGMSSAFYYLFVEKWDWPSIRAYLEEYVEGCADENWIRCGLRISRLARWEFEGDAINAINFETI